MLCHRLTYLNTDDEEEVLRRQLGMGLSKEGGGAVPKTAFDMIEDEPYATVADLVTCMQKVQDVHVSDVFVKHCVELVDRTRHDDRLDFGCSPRAGLALINASRARAFVYGRDFVIPEDMFELAEDIMLHRMRLTYEALAEGETTKNVLNDILMKDERSEG
jgi:MoxR-like ATPase